MPPWTPSVKGVFKQSFLLKIASLGGETQDCGQNRNQKALKCSSNHSCEPLRSSKVTKICPPELLRWKVFSSDHFYWKLLRWEEKDKIAEKTRTKKLLFEYEKGFNLVNQKIIIYSNQIELFHVQKWMNFWPSLLFKISACFDNFLVIPKKWLLER